MNIKDSSPTASNFASKRNFQGTNFNLKYIKPDYLNETEENEISIPSISPLRHGSSIAQSINEGNALLKCVSSSSSYQPGDSHKVEDLHRESYKDLLGFDTSQPGSHRSNIYIQAPFSITEESGGGQSPAKNTLPNRAGTRISARRDRYITFEGSQKKPKSDTDISTFKTGTGDITLDPQANSNQLNTEKTIMEPLSDIEAQNIALNMPNTPIDSPTENQNLVIPQVAPAPSPGQMTPEETRLFNMAVPEARIYVNKAIAGFAVAILTSICVLLPLSGVSYFETLLIGPFAYCIAWTVIEIYCTMKLVDFLYFDSGDFFKVFDMSNVIITLLVLQFRIANIISTSAYVSLLYFLAAHSYLYQSKGFIMKRLPMIITRYLYGFQVIFFLLRLDGYSDWQWKYVFSLTWILLAAKICGNLWRIVTVLYAILTKPYPRRITKILGFIWYFAAHSLVPIPLFAIYGFVVYWSPARDFSVITNTAIVCILVSAVLLAYTLLTRKYILAFILRLKLIKSLLVEYDREQERLKVRKEIALEVEMKEQYFVMLSSTYFLPLHKSFYAKGKESVDKIKSVFSKLRPNRKTNNKDNENRVETVGDVPRLRKDKLNLDLKLARLDDPKVRFSDRKGTDRLRTRDVGDIESSPVAQKDKMAMSMDELDKVRDWDASSIKPKPVNEEEEVCYLCYVNPRDVILMNCGHGGICYDCASTMVKQKNECMVCRKEVDSIIKIDPNPKAFNIVKGTESHKVVVKIIENNGNK